MAGFFIHLAVGQGFALGYAATFALLDQATWWLGGLLGLLHVAVALTVLVPLLAGVHPRMASHRAGPASIAMLEPPGLVGLNYGAATPLVAVAPERDLDGWAGYLDSRPVRVGNGAAGQHQLDGYGWVLDAAWLLTRAGHRLYSETWRAMAGFTDTVAAQWREPDAGIWEIRGDPADHVHSNTRRARTACPAPPRQLSPSAHSRHPRPSGARPQRCLLIARLSSPCHAPRTR